MKHWRVGLREEKGQWLASRLGDEGSTVLETRLGQASPGEALDQLLRELEDWDAYYRARYLD